MISIIVPVYNSEKTLEPLCHKLLQVTKGLNQPFEIVLVNDGSKDNSKKVINQLAKDHINIISIHLDQNYGQQNALLCGLRYSHGDYVVTIDDDLQYDPIDILKLIAKINEGYDVVYGVPKEKVHSTMRNIGSRFKEMMFHLFLKKPRNVTLTSFRIIRKSLVDKIILDQNSFVYLSAMTLKQTNNIANIKVKHYQRYQGQSNYSYKKLIRLMCRIIIYYSDNPLLKPFKRNKPQYVVKEIIK